MKIKENSWRKNCSLFRWMFRYWFFFTILLSLFSCQTLFKKKSFIPDDLSAYKSGFFSGTLSVYQKNQKNHFNGDIFISESGQLRMDLSVSPGLSVFTFLFDTKELTFLSLRKKEFYKGPVVHSGRALFFSKGLEFSVLREIFFDRRPEEKEWICKTDEKNLPLNCQNKIWTILWKRSPPRRLSFESADFKFLFQYFFFSSEVNKDMFNIEVPESFKQIDQVE